MKNKLIYVKECMRNKDLSEIVTEEEINNLLPVLSIPITFKNYEIIQKNFTYKCPSIIKCKGVSYIDCIFDCSNRNLLKEYEPFKSRLLEMEKSKTSTPPIIYLESDECLQEYLNSLTIDDCKDSIKDLPLDVVKQMVIEQYLQKGTLKIELFQKYMCNGFGWTFSSQGHSFWERVLLNKEFDVFYEKYPKKSSPQISSTPIKSELLDLLCKCEKFKTDCSSKSPVTNTSSLITDLENSVLKINTNNYSTNLINLIN